MAKYVIIPSIADHRIVQGPRFVRLEVDASGVGFSEPLGGVVNAVILSGMIWGMLAIVIF